MRFCRKLPHACRELRALPIIPNPGPLAQLVEQETLNLKVVGSIPTRPITASYLNSKLVRSWPKIGLKITASRSIASETKVALVKLPNGAQGARRMTFWSRRA